MYKMTSRYESENEGKHTKDYWNKFSIALKPNTLYKATAAAHRARGKIIEDDYVLVDGLPEDENGNFVYKTSSKRKSKKVNPQQSENEELCGQLISRECDLSQDEDICSLVLANKESQKCLQCLTEIAYGLADLSDANEAKKLHKKSKNLSVGSGMKEKDVESAGMGRTSPFIEMAEYMVKQTKDSFVVAYKLNETALGFHVAEDFLRDPERSSLLDFSPQGRIRIPKMDYTDVSFTQIGQVVTECLTMVDTFEENHPKEKLMITLLNVFAAGMRHFEATAEHCKNVFESLLYISGEGIQLLQKFIFSLNSFERSDVIMEVQSLRRRIDEITIALEKLSWRSHLILHRAKGCTLSATSKTKIKPKLKKSTSKTVSGSKNPKPKKSAPSSNAKQKKIKVKCKKKKSIAAEFIKNQKSLEKGDDRESSSDHGEIPE